MSVQYFEIIVTKLVQMQMVPLCVLVVMDLIYKLTIEAV